MANLFVKSLQLHQQIYESTGGWLGHRMMMGMPSLLLRSVGRKTGETRTSALIYGRDGEDYTVVASNGGARRSPGWLHNVMSQPDCEIQIGRQRLPVTARTVRPGDSDYARMWARMNKINRGQYGQYQSKTNRPIAIVALRPR
ncbi:nitroreductase family deazaflavin-dependent oxidoreductase [Tomitella biformata]|uniref:nitroreductase family deazaflavin-dependent oxidoreductase n=1 Tax=Tomitella biformata TaxID=630403 RepID=UPI0004637857|nr:nitroreductase family deazaflavin-dependent oxidoreductase [Tomitella biformata]